MKHFIALSAAVLLLPFLPLGAASAQDSSREADEAAIRKAIASYVAAFNSGDAEALAAHWGPQGEFVTPAGKTLRGRVALEAEFKGYFAESANAKLELVETSINFLSPNVAVESGVARVIVPEQEPSESEYEAVHVKTDDGWKIDSTREQVLPQAPPSHYEQLKDLEWMIGTWVDEGDSGVVKTTARWTTNSNFIVRSFKVFVEDRIDFEGTQIIGWDPHAKTIRSWMFDSDGGFGVGRWSGGGSHWSVQMLNVLADGRRASSTNVFDLVAPDTIEFHTIGRQIDGELLPNVKSFRVVRSSQQ